MTAPHSLALLSVAEMTAADKAAVVAGVPSLALMEAAGRAVAREIQGRWMRRATVVLCGPGNNGGDGFVIARLLSDVGWPVRLALLGRCEDLKGDAAVNAGRWQAMGGGIAPLTTEIIADRPLVVDALFGAGLSRALDGISRRTVELINEMKLDCIGVDVPSGVHGDTGEILPTEDGKPGVAPRCTATVTFFRAKPGHFLYPGRDLCGDTIVADIGIPPSVLTDIKPRTWHNAPALWKLPQPRWSDHKYVRGHAIVCGGAVMTGAARLSARAARRAGAGLLTLAVPLSAVPIYAADAPGSFVEPCDTPADLDRLLADRRRNGVLVGPGFGLGMETMVTVLKILAAPVAVVLDADALTSFQDDPQTLFVAIKRRQNPTVLTPHGGEFARLFSTVGGKLASARAAAAATGAVIISKGADTVVAAPDGRAAIANNAPPWLATGGTGDVLAGFVLGLSAQGVPPWEAASAAVWLHGETGLKAGRGLIAEDLPEVLVKVLESL